jgi:uncharacterized membrane protein
VLVPALVLRARTRGAEPTTADSAVPDRRKKERPRKPAKRAVEERGPSAPPTRPHCVRCGKDGAAGTSCEACGGEITDPLASAEVPDAGLRTRLIGLGARLSGRLPRWREAMIGLVAVVAIADLSSPFDPAVTLFSLLLAGLALASLGARGESRERSFAALLAAFGFVIVGLCEWLYFKDLFSMFPHLARMNTVFKFYVHAWVLLAAASVGLLDWLMREAWPRWSPPARAGWAVLAGLIAIGGLAYPALALHTRDYANPFPYGSIDGVEHFRTHSPADARAVDWLREHVGFTNGKPPVILEAWGVSFTPSGRVSTFTGFTTVIGWEGHEEQWRGSKEKPILGGIDASDNVRRRYEDAGTLYMSLDLEATRRLLARYKVQYVYIGELERKQYTPEALAKWAALGELVYTQDGVEIYAIKS